MSEIQDVLATLVYEDDDIDLGGKLVAGAVTVLHLVNPEDGGESIVIKNTLGMGAYTQSGLLSAAAQLANQLDNFDDGDDR